MRTLADAPPLDTPDAARNSRCGRHHDLLGRINFVSISHNVACDRFQSVNRTSDSALLPSVFIGSSSAALKVAQHLQYELQKKKNCLPTVWDQGVFTPSSSTLDALTTAAKKIDFAVLVVTPDDFLARVDSKTPAPRDNVIFELGFFMAALGRDRTYMVVDQTSEDIKLPTDVLGITYLPFTQAPGVNLSSALVGPVLSISAQIESLGPRTLPRERLATPVVASSRAAIGIQGAHLEVFEVRDAVLWHRWSTQTGWSDWTVKPMPAGMSAEHVGAGAHGQWVDLLVSGVDGRLFHQWWGPDTGWSDWAEWGDVGVQGPFAIASAAEGHNEIWATRNGSVQHQWLTENEWSGWRDFQ